MPSVIAVTGATGVGDALFVLFLGRLNANKGHDPLLKAFIRIQSTFGNLHLVFAGLDKGTDDLACPTALRSLARIFVGNLNGWSYNKTPFQQFPEPSGDGRLPRYGFDGLMASVQQLNRLRACSPTSTGPRY